MKPKLAWILKKVQVEHFRVTQKKKKHHMNIQIRHRKDNHPHTSSLPTKYSSHREKIQTAHKKPIPYSHQPHKHHALSCAGCGVLSLKQHTYQWEHTFNYLLNTSPTYLITCTASLLEYLNLISLRRP